MSSRLIWIVVCSAVTGILLGSAYSWIADHTQRQKAPSVSRPMPGAVRPTAAPQLPRGVVAVPGRAATAPSPTTATPAPSLPATLPVALTHWTESRGPIDLDGSAFTLQIEWTCGKFDAQKKQCGDAFGENVSSFSLLDARRQIQFKKDFPYAGNPDDGATRISVLRLKGHANHQALQIVSSDSPSAPDTGERSDFFAGHDGKLIVLAQNIAIGALGETQDATLLSAKLPPNDTFRVRHSGSPYYSTLTHMRFNWNAGRLEQVESNEFDVEPHLGDQPQDSAVDFYTSPDFNTRPRRLHIAPTTQIKVLKAVQTSTSHDTAGQKVVTEWLKITVDGRPGYIAGEADLGAIGLVPIG